MWKAKKILIDNYLTNEIVNLMGKANKTIMKIYNPDNKQIQTKKYALNRSQFNIKQKYFPRLKIIIYIYSNF